MQGRFLYPSRGKVLAYLAGSLGFTVVGALTISDGDRLGWLPAGFFGLGSAVFAAMLHPRLCYLRLGPEGFEERFLFVTRSFRWAEVGFFRTERAGLMLTNQAVVFASIRGEATGSGLRRWLDLLGREHRLQNLLYPLPPDALAEALNGCKVESECAFDVPADVKPPLKKPTGE